MKNIISLGWKIIRAGAWLSVLVLGTHILMSRVFYTYAAWPDVDILMHFAGGFAIAFFVSGCFRALPREEVKRSRIVLLELLLIGSLTVTAAVFWEFREFANDQLFGLEQPGQPGEHNAGFGGGNYGGRAICPHPLMATAGWLRRAEGIDR